MDTYLLRHPTTVCRGARLERSSMAGGPQRLPVRPGSRLVFVLRAAFWRTEHPSDCYLTVSPIGSIRAVFRDQQLLPAKNDRTAVAVALSALDRPDGDALPIRLLERRHRSAGRQLAS